MSDTKHLTLRMDTQMFEEIEALKPKGISMSAFLVQLIEQGKDKPESIYEKMAAKEIQLNRVVNQHTHDEMIRIENDKSHEAFHLSQGHITFNEIIEKHKVELQEKYG